MSNRHFTRRIALNASLAVALTAVLAVTTGCATSPAPVSVAETIATTPSLSTLNELVGKAGLTDTLKSAGPFTVFAPTNEAFKAVSSKTMAELAADPAKLKAVLTYHVLAANVPAAEIKSGKAKTVNGADINIAKAGAFVTVEESLVEKADLLASNGVVHLVDRVMLPPVKR